MRKYGAYLAALAAVTLIGPTAIAVAHAGKTQAKQGKHSFIVLGRHHQRVSLYVQHSRSKAARSAACPAGNFNPTYCSPPVQEDLFGAYAWNDGGVTFGSNSNSTCRALGWSSNPCGVYTRGPNRLLVAFVGSRRGRRRPELDGELQDIERRRLPGDLPQGQCGEQWRGRLRGLVCGRHQHDQPVEPDLRHRNGYEGGLRFTQRTLRRQPSGRLVRERDHVRGDGRPGDRYRSIEHLLLDEGRTELLAHDDGAGQLRLGRAQQPERVDDPDLAVEPIRGRRL